MNIARNNYFPIIGTLIVIFLFVDQFTFYTSSALAKDIAGRRLQDIVVHAQLIHLPEINDSKELNEFYGANDALSAPSMWRPMLDRWAEALCQVSKKFRSSTTEPWLPGETFKDRLLIIPQPSDIYKLTALGLVDQQDKNIYTKASFPYEAVFRRRITQKPPHSLEPKDVLRIALGVTHNDYGLAVLTVHNVFKKMAYNARAIRDDIERRRKQVEGANERNPDRGGRIKSEKKYLQEYDKGIKRLNEINRIVSPLKSLRADPTKTKDKMGPWYHIFALFVIDAYSGPESALFAVSAEHTAKRAKAFNKEGGFNEEKATIDFVFISNQAACRPIY